MNAVFIPSAAAVTRDSTRFTVYMLIVPLNPSHMLPIQPATFSDGSWRGCRGAPSAPFFFHFEHTCMYFLIMLADRGSAPPFRGWRPPW